MPQILVDYIKIPIHRILLAFTTRDINFQLIEKNKKKRIYVYDTKFIGNENKIERKKGLKR